MRQRWADVSFVHWPVDPDRVQAVLPVGLEPDRFDSKAWVSLVGFEMRQLRVSGLPTVPTTGRFSEFNVRTYVRGPKGPGVWFASLDVRALLPVVGARMGFALPYCLARIQHESSNGQVRWEITRRWPSRSVGGFTMSVGSELEQPDALDDWLTARWALYSATRSGRLVWAPVHHEPWRLRRASVITHAAGLAATAGLAVDGAPQRAHHADVVHVSVGRPRLLDPAADPPLVLFFDQDCGLCDASVGWLAKRTGTAVEYRQARTLPEGSSLARLSRDALVAVANGRVLGGPDAVVAALARARRPWPLAAELLSLPVIRSVTAVVYRWVAHNRGALSRRLGLAACSMPPSQSFDERRDGRRDERQ